MSTCSPVRLVVGAGLLCSSACGSSDQEEFRPFIDDCSLDVELSGAVEASRSGRDGLVCGVNGSDSHFQIIYLGAEPSEGSLELFAVTVEEVTEGETGTGFPAHLILSVDDNFWETPIAGCTVTLAEHSFVQTTKAHDRESRRYFVDGSGSCGVEAEGSWDTSRVAVSPFDFQGSVVWGD